jgi:16S rRNA (cytidine1402-2'-O)-methyltransferase
MAIYLIPSFIGNNDKQLIAPVIISTIEKCDIIFAENLKTTRHFLKAIGVEKKIDDFEWYELTLQQFIKACTNKNAAVISEAGAPGIADPGAALVALAHQQQMKVVPLPGLSSILMALMASGSSGQSFAFNGYLPIDRSPRIAALKELELLAKQKKQSQLFMETPYRNNALFADILAVCQPPTRLCIAADISLDTEFILTQSIANWKKQEYDFHKRPAVFLIATD